MQHGRLKAAMILAGMVFAVCGAAWAQQIQPRSQNPARGAEGTMTVTVTVVSSVGVVVGPDGQQRIIVANAEDPKDSVPNLPLVKVVTLSPVPEPQPDAKAAPSKLQKRP